MTKSASDVISCSRVRRSFGGVVAVKSATFTVPEGTITAVIGPNGAGKTTLMNLLSGLDRASDGEIVICGERTNDMPAHEISGRLRVGRTFQTPHVFPSLTALGNVAVGRHSRSSGEFTSAIFTRGRANREERATWGRAQEMLTLAGLGHKSGVAAGNLSFGEQRLVEIARSLALEPRCLLMDEPGAGLNDQEVESLGELLQSINSQGVTIVLIDHKMDLVMGASDQVVVLNFGEVLAAGTPKEIRHHPAVIDAYLGGGSHDD